MDGCHPQATFCGAMQRSQTLLFGSRCKPKCSPQATTITPRARTYALRKLVSGANTYIMYLYNDLSDSNLSIHSKAHQ